jgi:hypothetical protein
MRRAGGLRYEAGGGSARCPQRNRPVEVGHHYYQRSYYRLGGARRKAATGRQRPRPRYPPCTHTHTHTHMHALAPLCAVAPAPAPAVARSALPPAARRTSTRSEQSGRTRRPRLATQSPRDPRDARHATQAWPNNKQIGVARCAVYPSRAARSKTARATGPRSTGLRTRTRGQRVRLRAARLSICTTLSERLVQPHRQLLQ